jgi:hypothetical protein
VPGGSGDTGILNLGISSGITIILPLPFLWAPSTHWIKDWVGLRASLDAVVKRQIMHLVGNTVTIYPTSSHFTDRKTIQTGHNRWDFTYRNRNVNY